MIKTMRSTILAILLGLHAFGFLIRPQQAYALDAGPPDVALQVKAAYLFKFGNYVQWPPASLAEGAPIVIGVVGQDKIADELTRIAMGRSIGTHAVIIKRLQFGDNTHGVHMLFIGKGASKPVNDWLTPLQGQPILFVTEEDSGMPVGSVINLVLDSNRVRFDVSQMAAERNHLELSASLLAVARNVQKEPVE